MPFHYMINKGNEEIRSGRGNYKWNLPEYSDVIYPNIKLYLKKTNDHVVAIPALDSYRRGTIPIDDPFRKAGPWTLDFIPKSFFNNS